MLALRTNIPHTVWAQDPQAVWTAAELLGWLEDQEVDEDEQWRSALAAQERRPPANSPSPAAG
jgi:anti-sigma regulatory factor (Ser/Thr protein kinase)